MRELLAGQRDQVCLEYPCHSPAERRWFEMRATRFNTSGGSWLVVAHEDITSRKLAEQALQETRELAVAARYEEQERLREAERRREIAEGLGDVLAALNSNQFLEEVLDLIAAQARRLFDTRAVGIYSLEAEVGTLAIEASKGLLITYVAGSDIPIGHESLRQAMVSSQPVAVPDVTTFPSDVGVLGSDVQHQVSAGSWADLYRAWLAVPIVSKDQVYGGMLLYYAEPRVFFEDDVELAVAFADQAALAVENSRLRDQIERAAASAERDRLARDLHDAVTQTLFSASLIAEAMPRIWESRPEEARRGLEELRHLTRGALAEMRTMLVELRPAALTEKPLDELLRHLTEAMTSRTRVPITLTVEGNSSLKPVLQVALYRITQEALNNVAKHAGASQATVDLHCRSGYVALNISDDGCGFDPGDIRPDRIGMGIMRERAESVGAVLEIDSQPGRGTRVLVNWLDMRGETA
jgi:signal transduction histidine kinase